MAITPDAVYQNPTVSFNAQDGRAVLVLTGVVLFSFSGTGPSWRRDSIDWEIGPKWTRLDGVAPMAALASISNRGTSVDAGWAVDQVTWEGEVNDAIRLRAQLAVSDSDGLMHRITYTATAIGEVQPQ